VGIIQPSGEKWNTNEIGGDVVNSKFVGLVLGLVGMLFVVGCGSDSAPSPTPTKAAAAATATPATASATKGSGVAGELIQVTHGENPYAFQPATVELKAGKPYTFDFSVPTEFHTFTVAGLGIDVFINANEKVTHNVTVDKIGEFDLICVPHMTMGMVGKVKVS
jgi:plastocyanin